MKRQLIINLIIICIICLINYNCQYKFANTLKDPIIKSKSVCIEGIYDTSKEVLPHEILWENLQKALIQNGLFYVVGCKEADLIIRIHLFSSNVAPYGAPKVYGPNKDHYKGNIKEPINPNDFRILTKAGSYTVRENIGVNVQIQVIDLYTKKEILNKNYAANQIFWSLRSDAIAERKSHFLLYEEALRHSFSTISDQISKKAVSDILESLALIR